MEWDIYMSKTSSSVLHYQMISIRSHLSARRWIVLLYWSQTRPIYLFMVTSNVFHLKIYFIFVQTLSIVRTKTMFFLGIKTIGTIR
jgi:hypothetical protein